MAGFYPVCVGTPYYVLGSLVFKEVAFKLDNGKTFKIKRKNNTRHAPYIQSANLNGKPFTHTYLTYQEISKGGTLMLVLGKTPNKTWGADMADAPPANFE